MTTRELHHDETGKDRDEILQKFYALASTVNVEFPDREQVERVKKFIAENSSVLWDTNNLANNVIDEMLNTSTKKEYMRLKIGSSIDKIKEDLGYSSSSVVEKIVIDTIVISWLRYLHMEQTYNRIMKETTGSDRHFLKFIDNLISTSQKRFLRAIDSLVHIRKTGVNLQINIATNVTQQKISQKNR